MSDALEPLIADFVAWIAKEERSYADVMDAGERLVRAFPYGKRRRHADC